jgi:1-hydroxycarotenoid 3,4-desaturase
MESAGQNVVVIGAGMGGLAAAIRLAAAGTRVTLVEAAGYPGGKMRTVPSDAGPVDAGPTVLTLRQVFDDLFALCGERLDDHLALIPQPLLARHWWPDGSRLDLFSDVDASVAAIEDFAGAFEAAGFMRFHRATAALYSAFEKPVMLAPRPDVPAILRAAMASPRLWPALMPGVSLDWFVGQYFRDPRLRQLFGRYATYVGGRPDHAPAVLALIWQAEARGVWAVDGGMHKLAEALAALADRRGVELRYGTAVSQILRQAGCVSGVQLADGRVIACNHVVFNGDPAALRHGLLGDGPQAALPRNATEPRSLSAQVWSFSAELGGSVAAELVHHNVFFASDPTLEFGPIGEGRLPNEPTIYLCAEDRAKKTFPAGKERIEIVLNAPAITHGSTQDPEEALHCRTKTLHLLRRIGLTFLPEPEADALTTPHQLALLFPGSMGSIYGRSPEGLMASFQRPGARTALRGLYLAGGGAHPGAGVPMAALSGKHAAEAMLKDLTSASKLAPTVMRGGMSTVSRMMGRVRFRS